MEKVYKVSISGISFSLEEDAYGLVRSYLDELSAHYANKPNGNEIVEGIEGRIAELFIDHGGKNRVVTATMAKEVLSIIGKPEEIFDDQEESASDTSTSRKESVKKRLYRNPSDKKISGVCGGLGIYFGIDPLWFRIGFLALLLISTFTNKGIWNPTWFVVAYCALWICMPLAQTTRQKCEMRGESLSYDDIEREVANRREYEESRSDESSFLSVLCKLILVFIGFVFAIVGFSGIISILAVMLGLSVAGLAVPSVVTNLLASMAGVPVWVGVTVKILAAIAVLLPFVGILLGGVCLIFRMKTPVWKPALAGFLLWLVSVIGLTAITLSASTPFWKPESVKTSISLEGVNDTLRIQFTGLEEWKDSKIIVKGDEDEFSLEYIDDSDKHSPRAAVYPKIGLNRGCKNTSADFSCCSFSNPLPGEMTHAELLRLSNDTLFVSPVIYGQGKRMKEALMEIELNIPDNTKVMIEEPISHGFDKDQGYSDIKLFDMIVK